MKLHILKGVADFISKQDFIYHLKRINDNLLKLEFKNHHLYFDMTKSYSNIFISEDDLIPSKKYNAPFDITLLKLSSHAKVLKCVVDGDNRILQIYCTQNSTYKNTCFLIQFEFTGKHTNVIFLDENNIVIDALRHINIDKSSREVKINKPLLPLSQPLKKISEEKKLTEIELLEKLKNSYHDYFDKKLSEKKEIILKQIDKKILKLQILLQDLPKQEELQLQALKLSKEATILLANLNKIQNYASEVEINDFDGNILKINIPESKNPQIAINLMFKESKKLTKKAKNNHIQAQNLKDKIEFLQLQKNFIKNVTNIQDLIILEPKKITKKSPSKYEVIFIEGFKISIGRNKNENQMLLKEAKADDIWLHIKDIPSSHMIIHCGKNKVYDNVIKKAGEILVGLNCIQIGDFNVDYTKRKFVKITEGSNVVYSKYKTLSYRK